MGLRQPRLHAAVDHRVAELRKALDDESGNPTWIETVAGLGYRFVGPVRLERDRG